MKLEIRHSCAEADSYRAASIKSLFNCQSGANFSLDADLPFEDLDWKIGVIVGPSGSGKTSLGRAIFGPEAMYSPTCWRDDAPIIDCINAEGSVDDVTAALAAVGLGSVPTWLRPYSVLSNGEKFRADLAAVICNAPDRVVIDEFSSVVDRQIAQIGASAFQKAWRRTEGQAVLLSCHYDILDYVEADWVFDTQSGRFLAGREHWKRPKFELQIEQVDGSYWPLFEPHHYLTLPRMVAARYFVAFVDGQPVAHVALSPRLEVEGVRACRMVVLPEWQGAGIGLRFLNAVLDNELAGKGRYGDRVKRAYFHTSHPGLNAALRRADGWEQISTRLYDADSPSPKRVKGTEICQKERSGKSIRKAKGSVGSFAQVGGYGGHYRAVTGWRRTK